MTTSTRYVRLLVTMGMTSPPILIFNNTYRQEKTTYLSPINALYPCCVLPYRASRPEERAPVVTIASPGIWASVISGCAGSSKVRRNVPLPCVTGRRGKGCKGLVSGVAGGSMNDSYPVGAGAGLCGDGTLASPVSGIEGTIA